MFAAAAHNGCEPDIHRGNTSLAQPLPAVPCRRCRRARAKTVDGHHQGDAVYVQHDPAEGHTRERIHVLHEQV